MERVHFVVQKNLHLVIPEQIPQKNTSPLKSAASATWTDQRDGSDNTGLSCCLRLPGRESSKAEHWFIHYLFSDPVENGQWPVSYQLL